jgi:hypothetical protein
MNRLCDGGVAPIDGWRRALLYTTACCCRSRVAIDGGGVAPVDGLIDVGVAPIDVGVAPIEGVIDVGGAVRCSVLVALCAVVLIGDRRLVAVDRCLLLRLVAVDRCLLLRLIAACCCSTVVKSNDR